MDEDFNGTAICFLFFFSSNFSKTESAILFDSYFIAE